MGYGKAVFLLLVENLTKWAGMRTMGRKTSIMGHRTSFTGLMTSGRIAHYSIVESQKGGDGDDEEVRGMEGDGEKTENRKEGEDEEMKG